MTTYLAVVEQDEDSAFGVTFPDVPGCFSAADRAEDVLSHAMQALELHIGDAPAPTPRALAQIKADKNVSAALAAGGYLLSVPLVRSERRPVRINVSLDAGTVKAIDDAARMRGLTRSAFIAEAALKEAKFA